jgi:hypothetical protein
MHLTQTLIGHSQGYGRQEKFTKRDTDSTISFFPARGFLRLIIVEKEISLWTTQKWPRPAKLRTCAVSVGLSLLAVVVTGCGTVTGPALGAVSGAAIGAASGNAKTGALIGAQGSERGRSHL